MKPWLWAAIGMSLASVGGIAACSSDSGGSGSSGDDDGTGGGGTGGTGQTSGTTAPTTSGSMTTGSTMMQSSSTGMPPMGCEDEPDTESCYDCFVMENPGGYEAFATALLLGCACDTMAMPAPTCLATCDTDNAMDDVCPAAGQVNLMAMNQACIDCINGLDNMTEPCLGQMGSFITNCQADPDCVDFVTDVQGCP